MEQLDAHPLSHSMVAQILDSLVELLEAGVDRRGRLDGKDRAFQLLQRLGLEIFRQRRLGSKVLDHQLLGAGPQGRALDVPAARERLDAVGPDGQRREVLTAVGRHGARTETSLTVN